MAISGSSGQPLEIVEPEPKVETTVTEKTIERKPTIPELISQYSSEYGVDGQVAQAIAFCESTNRHFDQSGKVLRGAQNNKDVGLFQINEYYHLNQSQSLGYNIYSLEGNIGYAMYLLSKQGSQPWHWSKDCWSRRIAGGY